MLFKKKKKQIMACLDSSGHLIRTSELRELPLKEDYILQISKDEYQNEEPCIIIRTNIAGDVYNRLSRFLLTSAALGDAVPFDDLPEEFRSCIEWDPRIRSIRLQEG